MTYEAMHKELTVVFWTLRQALYYVKHRMYLPYFYRVGDSKSNRIRGMI